MTGRPPQDWDSMSGNAKARLLARVVSYLVRSVCFGEAKITYKDLANVPELGFAPDGDRVVFATSDQQPSKRHLYVLVRDPDGACTLHRMDEEAPGPDGMTVATFLAPSESAAQRIAERIAQENAQ